MTRAALVLLLAGAPAPGEEVVVRVVRGDDPVPSAGVRVVAADDDVVFDVAAWTPDVLTDARGEAMVDAGEGGRVLVYVPGFELAVRGTGRGPVDVALKPERVFTGTVVDAQGGPVAGAAVTLRSWDVSYPVRTGADGRFAVHGLGLDEYALNVEAPGFLPGGQGEVTGEDSGIVLALARPGRIRGRIVDGTGDPVAGATVNRVFTSGEDGTFVMERVSPGPLELRVSGPHVAEPVEVIVGDGEEKSVDIVVLRPVTARLHVIDAQGKALPGAATWTMRLGESGASDEKGRLTLEVPAGVEERFGVVRDGFFSKALSVPPSAPGTERDLGDVVLELVPVGEVRVRLPDGSVPDGGTVSGTPLREGAARVRAFSPGRKPATLRIAVPGFPQIETDFEPPGPMEVVLPEPLWLRGIVFDPDGRPVAGAAISPDATTDAEGRFRLGPYLSPEVGSVGAEKGDLRCVVRDVRIGDAELELRLAAEARRVLRGIVLRGGVPVSRFDVAYERFVREDGRFEIVLDDREALEGGWVRISAGGRDHVFALPPEGEELVARLPCGRIRALLADRKPDVRVTLSAGDGTGDAESTDADGRTAFAEVPAGRSRVEAKGYAPADVVLGEDGEAEVTLAPLGTGRLRLRPWEYGDGGEWQEVELPAGLHELRWLVVRIRAGEVTTVDLAPPTGARLRGAGARSRVLRLMARLESATFEFHAAGGEDGTFEFVRLPAGSYALDGRRFELREGQTLELDLGEPLHVLRGSVVRADGKPAQGAAVELRGAGRTSTDTAGRFALGEIAAGEYACLVHLPGYGRAETTVRVPDTLAPPIVLREDSGARLRVVGPDGRPLQIDLRVSGHEMRTNPLGEVALPALPARVDAEVEGLATVRDLEVHGPRTLRLERAATLLVLSDGPVTARVGGRDWPPRPPRFLSDEVPGRLLLDDLPPGVVEVVGVGRDPLPVLVQAGREAVVDLRGR